MTPPGDEAVVAYIDGTMDDEALALFEARLAEDPALAEHVAAHRRVTQQIVAAYGAPHDADTGVDASLIARLALGSDNVVALPDRSRSIARPGNIWVVRIAALAASTVFGVFIGQQMLAPNMDLIAEAEGQLTARGELASGLSNQLAGEPGRVRIGVSFRTEHGLCRTFGTTEGLSGIGCREGREWRLPVLVKDATAKKNAMEYRLASGNLPPSVMAQVDREIKGDPLDPAAEARARKAGWR